MAITAQGSGTITAVTTNRSVADGVTNTTTTITSATAAFVAGDIGRIVTGSADLASSSYIASVTNGTTAVLNKACTASHSSQTFALSQEMVMLDVATAGAYELYVDKTAMASLDVVEFRLYAVVLTGGALVCGWPQRYMDAQPTDDLLAMSSVIATELTDNPSIRFSIKQTAGTGRAFPWKVLKIG